MKLLCDEARLELPALARGELEDPRRAAVEEHLLSCPACREIQALDASIDALFACDVAPGAAPGFAKRVRAAVDAENAGRPAGAPRPMRRLVTVVALLAASALLAVGVWLATRPSVPDEEVVANLDVLEMLELTRGEDVSILDFAAIERDPALEALLRSTSAEEF